MRARLQQRAMEMTSKVAEASKAAAGAAMAAAQEVGKEVSRAAAEMGGTRLEKFQSAWRQIDYLLREEDEGDSIHTPLLTDGMTGRRNESRLGVQ